MVPVKANCWLVKRMSFPAFARLESFYAVLHKNLNDRQDTRIQSF